jgi:hypothetical protein
MLKGHVKESCDEIIENGVGGNKMIRKEDNLNFEARDRIRLVENARMKTG